MIRPHRPRKSRVAGLALVVDDMAMTADFTRLVLEVHGWRVVTARTGPAGIKAFLARPDEFAVVVSDVVHPDGMSGPEMVEWLLSFRPDLPVVFATGWPQQVPEPLRQRFPVIEKPFPANTLIEAVQTALAQHSS